MPILSRKLLHVFSPEKPKDILTIEVPTGSVYRDSKVLQDGIYMWFEIPQIEVGSIETRRYKILNGTEPSIPQGANFVIMLDTVIENEQGQHVIIFPIYELT